MDDLEQLINSMASIKEYCTSKKGCVGCKYDLGNNDCKIAYIQDIWNKNTIIGNWDVDKLMSIANAQSKEEVKKVMQTSLF